MSASHNRRPVHHPATGSQLFGDEAVIVSGAENVVCLLNPVGSRIWELCDGSRTAAHIARVLTEEFEVDLAAAQQAVTAFLDELVAKKLVAWS